jgi:LETM1 and EF-hand domain-containing protein 1
MLPSTYEWQSKKEEGRAKRLKANLEIAKFLQETMTEISVDLKKTKGIDAEAFSDFMQKVKKNEKVTNKDILKVSQLFQDEFTLDKISREQLVAMDRYLSSSSSTLAGKWFSTDFLRTRLGNKIEKIKQDDRLIRRDGLDALTLEELVDASLVRGMKVEGLNKQRIKQQLQEWLDLSQNQNVPPSLLILSRAFMLTQKIKPEEALEDTLAHIPAEALEEVARELPRSEDERAVERLAELEKEKALIEQTVKEEQEREKAKKKLEKEKKRMAEEGAVVMAIDVEATKKVIAAAAEVADEQEKEIIQNIEHDIEEIKHQQEILEDVLEEMPKGALEEDKRPKVLAEKLKDILHDLEEEIEKIEKEHKEDGKKEKEKEQRLEKDHMT